ncbi:MAG TPA: putative oxidoreductase C-terminal domain-containing protein, partial [Vicinamibacteria bacterium]|nr:putative oxidoreductase C-terminal domain-containing protein [Vicinamibacteria bacterium]
MTTTKTILASGLALGAAVVGPGPSPGVRAEGSTPMADVRFMTLDPGHFHAALVQKEMYPGVSPTVHVYAPLGPELLEHLGRVMRFNHRADRPTAWAVEVHTGPDFLARMLRDKPGNAVVISGRNRGKIGRIQASLDGGLHALVDKPWILEASNLPDLERALATAEEKGTVAFDIMTERFEVTSELQRELVNDSATFGRLLGGSESDPAVYMESVHFLMKTVAGAPLIRPPWFFDTDEQGEGLNDIGTHLVDLVQWTLFPEEALDHRKDVTVLSAYRWPTPITRPQFKRVTGGDFPASIARRLRDDTLEYFCNTLVSYTVRDIHVKLNVIWDWEAAPGAGDSHFALYRGSRSRIEVRQGAAEKHRPELYVVPNAPADKAAVLAAVRAKLTSVQARFPGVGVAELGSELRVTVPDGLRVGHEEHFAQVAQRFLRYVRDRSTLPLWERPNMLAKYHVTTRGTAMAREAPVQVAPRLA